MSFTALIPGLKISVDGVRDEQNRIAANTITFSADDPQTADAVQAGLVPTQEAVQEEPAKHRNQQGPDCL